MRLFCLSLRFLVSFGLVQGKWGGPTLITHVKLVSHLGSGMVGSFCIAKRSFASSSSRFSKLGTLQLDFQLCLSYTALLQLGWIFRLYFFGYPSYSLLTCKKFRHFFARGSAAKETGAPHFFMRRLLASRPRSKSAWTFKAPWMSWRSAAGIWRSRRAEFVRSGIARIGLGEV